MKTWYLTFFHCSLPSKTIICVVSLQLNGGGVEVFLEFVSNTVQSNNIEDFSRILFLEKYNVQCAIELQHTSLSPQLQCINCCLSSVRITFSWYIDFVRLSWKIGAGSCW